MRVRRGLLAVALALLLLLAGCASKRGPEPQPGPGFEDGGMEEDGTEAPGSSPAPSSSRPRQGGSTTAAPSSSSPPPQPGQGEDEPASPASPPRVWASPESAAIRPGASLDGGNCTANFVFTSPDNATVYLGTAAHCFGTGGPTETDGCLAGTEDLGQTVDVDGASAPAVLVYSSWVTMQEKGETNREVCGYNDFALLQLSAADYGAVSPAMKVYGGPVGLADPSTVGSMDKVLTYGNSGLRPQDSPLSPKEGYVTDPPGDRWTLSVYTVTPGIPGDSGSGVLTGDGRALGDLVTVSADGSNGVSVLSLQLAYARQNGFDVRLATWELLDGGLLP